MTKKTGKENGFYMVIVFNGVSSAETPPFYVDFAKSINFEHYNFFT